MFLPSCIAALFVTGLFEQYYDFKRTTLGFSGALAGSFAPFVLDLPKTVNIANGLRRGDFVAEVITVDIDGEYPLTYSLSGAGASRFDVQLQTGSDRIGEVVLDERICDDAQFKVTVVASDTSGQSASGELTIVTGNGPVPEGVVGYKK